MLRIVLDGISSGKFSYVDTVARIVLKWSWAHYTFLAVPVEARSKKWLCGRSLAGIAGSNPTGGVDGCVLRVLCVVR